MSPKQPASSFLSRTVVFLLLLPPCIHAQDVPKLQLIIRERLPVTAAGLVRYLSSTPPECDSAGNIYMQVTPPFPADPLVQPVTKISADGQHVTIFSLNSVPGLAPKSSISTFTVSPRGQVCVLAHNGGAAEFIAFRDDGQF